MALWYGLHVLYACASFRAIIQFTPQVSRFYAGSRTLKLQVLVRLRATSTSNQRKDGSNLFQPSVAALRLRAPHDETHATSSLCPGCPPNGSALPGAPNCRDCPEVRARNKHGRQVFQQRRRLYWCARPVVYRAEARQRHHVVVGVGTVSLLDTSRASFGVWIHCRGYSSFYLSSPQPAPLHTCPPTSGTQAAHRIRIAQ